METLNEEQNTNDLLSLDTGSSDLLQSYMRRQIRSLHKEKKDLQERYRPQVARRVRRDLLIDLIAEREEIEATDREVGLEIRRMKETGELRPAVDEEELAGRVKDRIRAKKTVDMLMDKADVKIETKPKPQAQGGSQ